MSISNLLEYAAAYVPLPGTSAEAASPGFDPATNRLSLTFLRSRGDLLYRVQSAPDLSTWTDVAVNPGLFGSSTTVQAPASTSPRAFLRLLIQPRTP
jgi:hypothetical protein